MEKPLANHKKGLLQISCHYSAGKKSWAIPDDDRCLSECTRKQKSSVDCFRCRLFSGDNLQKFHSINRCKKMRYEKSLRMLTSRGEVRDRQRRCVGCNRRLLVGERCNGGKLSHLQGRTLKNGFDKKT